MPTMTDGVLGLEHHFYNGKRYETPVFDPASPVVLHPDPARTEAPIPHGEPVVETLHTIWDIGQFLRPRRPISLGVLTEAELLSFARPGAQRVLDMPIKFPDGDAYRLPRAFAQFAPAIQ